MTTLSVTVVIPTLNEERHIGRCLEALSKLDYPKEQVSIVVADNFSEDGTLHIASQYGVKIVKVPRKTIAHNRNVGAGTADTDLIAFVDADCLVDPKWLRNGVPHFDDSRVQAVGSYYCVPDDSNELQKTWSNLCKGERKDAHETDWLPSGNLLVRASAFKQTGGFDESLVTCEDVDLGYRLAKVGAIINDPAVTVYHLGEPRTLRQLFRKEVWHSKSNLAGALAHGLKLSEIPSLIMPLIFGAGLVVSLCGALWSQSWCFLGVSLITIPIMMYVIRGSKITDNVILVLFIYCTYLLARALGIYRELVLFIFNQLKLQYSRNIQKMRLW